MKDIELFNKLNLDRNFSNSPFYCGEFEKKISKQLYINAWKQYGEGYTPSYVEITCPMLEGGSTVFYASGNEFSFSLVRKILCTIKKCIEFYK